MRLVPLTPHATSLSQSMRDLGYSLQAAIADLIDNSITAESDHIQLFLNHNDTDEPYVAILDNGYGMSRTDLLEAMRPGTRNPREKRSASDLGRFGLGLKTASFSQCRCLTVISRKDGKISGAQWDLDLISERNQWLINRLTRDEIRTFPHVRDLPRNGTLVIWQKLDRLLEADSPEQQRRISQEKFMDVERHIALVFHRYIGGNYGKRRVQIDLNGGSIEAFDPFFTNHKATQLLHQDKIRVNGYEITIQPYILPHHSKLPRKDQDFYASRGNFVDEQGAYIYRNGRLMAWGNWFGLASKSEATKLARVQIDFPNALDDLWTIDIKKARAYPPAQVRERMRDIIGRISENSKRVHSGRGKRSLDRHEAPLWERIRDRDAIRYTINRNHPLLVSFRDYLPAELSGAFSSYLSMIERSIPLEAIYADYAQTPQSFEERSDLSFDELKTDIEALYALFDSSNVAAKEKFKKLILASEPFSGFPKWTAQILKGMDL